MIFKSILNIPWKQRTVFYGVEFGDDVDGYLDWAKHGNLQTANASFLILDTFNVFMRNPEHICCYFGARCIRRDGLFEHKCWLSQVRSNSYRLCLYLFVVYIE